MMINKNKKKNHNLFVKTLKGIKACYRFLPVFKKNSKKKLYNGITYNF